MKTRYFVIAAGLLYLAIMCALTLDWYTKYALYIEHRDAFYALLDDPAANVDKLKSTAAYFQGAATRRLDHVKEAAIVLGVSLIMFALFFRFMERNDNVRN